MKKEKVKEDCDFCGRKESVLSEWNVQGIVVGLCDKCDNKLHKFLEKNMIAQAKELTKYDNKLWEKYSKIEKDFVKNQMKKRRIKK